MSRPNLLFLFTDEQRADTMSAYGNTAIHTPNLDRLASQSTVFDQAYVTQPVCTPSRSSILTGLWPHANGCTANNIPLRPDTPCLPEMLASGDYATAYHGKWHLGDELYAQHGFDEWVSIEDMYNRWFTEGRDKEKASDYYHYLIDQGFTPKNGKRFGRMEATSLPEEYGKPAMLGREASRFIRQNADNPFCLYVNFLEPHMPFSGPRNDQHDIWDIHLPRNFDAKPTELQPLKTRVLQRQYEEHGHGGMPLKTEKDWRRLIANYWGLCSLVDTYVGQILDTLDECGLADNTIVVYTSDHGDMMGSHRLLAKTVMFQEAVTVPLLVRLPGQKEMRRVPAPVSQIDLVPTLLDLMDQPVPDHLHGESLKELVTTGKQERASEDAFIQWNSPYHQGKPKPDGASGPDWQDEYGLPEEIIDATADPVRTIVSPDGWKMNWSPLGEHELYNLDEDPFERHNLAMEADHRPRMREMAERVLRWQERVGDEVELPTL